LDTRQIIDFGRNIEGKKKMTIKDLRTSKNRTRERTAQGGQKVDITPDLRQEEENQKPEDTHEFIVKFE
jgi:hypothetical protein